MSKFFIEHPIFANVIAIITMILGAVALFNLPIAQYPEITPPTIQVTHQLSRRQRRDRRQDHRHPDRAGGQRRRGRDLHVVDQRQRRQLHAHHQLRGRHRSEHLAVAGAELRQHGARAVAGRRHRAGRHRRKVSTNILLVVNLYLRRRPLRRDVPRQLRHHQHAVSAGALAGRRPGQGRRRRQVQHAGVARSEQAAVLRADDARRAAGDPAAERRGRRRPARRPAGAERPGLPVHRQRAGPAVRRRGVREHHRQEPARRRDRADRPHQGLGARRAEPADLHQLLAGLRQARRAPGRLHAARRQRPRGRRRRCGRTSRRRRRPSRPGSSRRPSTTRPSSSSRRSPPSTTRCSRRRSWC